MRLIFVTGNPGKLAEARHLLGDLATIDQDAQGYDELQADTLEAVARHGLDQVGHRLDPPFFLEDAGLFVDALQGFPGVYSAYAHRTIGCDGILRLLADHPPGERTAQFRAVIAYRDPDGTDHLFTGTASGHIAPAPRGDGGFGYDPIFIPGAHGERTFAEHTPDEKGQRSHRGAALRAFRAHLEAHPPTSGR